MKKIIYQNNEGGIAIITPTPDALSTYTVEQIAAKDVPHGKPYKIVDESEIPTDRTFRAAWGIDASLLTDGIGAEHSSF